MGKWYVSLKINAPTDSHPANRVICEKVTYTQTGVHSFDKNASDF